MPRVGAVRNRSYPPRLERPEEGLAIYSSRRRDLRRSRSSAHRRVDPRPARRREDDLPELVLPRPEGAGAGQQVAVPEAAEALAVALAEGRPGALEVGVPGHQGAVVVGPEVVPVL